MSRMKYLVPILFSLPTLSMWILFFYARLDGAESDLLDEWVMSVVGLSFVGFTACIAMLFVRPQAKEWIIAAIFNSISFVLILAWVLFFAVG